jgi:signal transduction histidine kinase
VEGWRVRKNGAPFYVTGVLTAIRDDDQKLIGFANIIRDATERRDAHEKLVEAREQLAMAQKMEAIGKLTGGIAHDFNNLLMIIGGNAKTVRRLFDPKLPRALEAIQTAAKRGESLTRQLLTFSRCPRRSSQRICFILAPKRLQATDQGGGLLRLKLSARHHVANEVACHCLPRVAMIPRAFRASAICRSDVAPLR